VYIRSVVVLLVGLWLIASPRILGEAPIFQPDVLSVVVSGLLIALLAAGNLWAAVGSRVLGWIIAALGAWVAAAPFVFGYASNTPWTWSSVIRGGDRRRARCRGCHHESACLHGAADP
jgi:hypothetical protein